MTPEPLTADDLYLDPPDDADGDPVFDLPAHSNERSGRCFPDEPVGGDPFAVAELSRGLTASEAESLAAESATKPLDVTAATAIYRKARELAIAEWHRLPPAIRARRTFFELTEQHAKRLRANAGVS